jgi:hypothetical protein
MKAKKLSSLVGLCIFSQVWMFSGLADEIQVKNCSGIIKSKFETLGIDAKWDIDWPCEMPGTKENVLQKIQEQICYDAFISSTLGSRKESTNVVPWRADSAQLYVFKKALEKASEQEESFQARAFDFGANLKINFVTDGYIGYTLQGYENEGGNGCHSYTIARVISLTTGKALLESDLLLTNNFIKLRDFIIKKSVAKSKVDPKNLETGDFFGGGTFMLEPDGIRWYIPPYIVYPGCAGVVDVLLTWDELAPYFASKKYLDQFRKFHLTYNKIKRTKDLE